MNVGEYKVIVRPAMLVLGAAIATALIAIPVVKHLPTDRVPRHGYIHPERWKFDARDGAVAAIKTIKTTSLDTRNQAESNSQPNAAPETGSVLNSENGFTITVYKPGKSPASVYLRNSLNLDRIVKKEDLTLTLDARAPAPFSITVIIRDAFEYKHGSPVVWSKSFDIPGGSEWTSYSAAIPQRSLHKSQHASCLIAAHMGGQLGVVALRKIHLQ